MLAHSIPFSPDSDAEVFAQIPTGSGVFLLRGREQHSEPYVSKAANLRRRIMRLLSSQSGQTGQGISKRLNLRDRCAAIEFTPTGSDFENIVLLYRTVRELFPENYARRMRFNFSPLIRINWENKYPRAYVTRKAGPFHSKAEKAKRSTYYGPFRSRAIAEKSLNDALDLFKSRRCTFELNPDPNFPGCVYSEMKMCLAPCFKGCSDEEYIREVARVQEFFESRGESLLNELAEQRDRQSAELDFESAAAIHGRVEKVKTVARGFDEIVRRLDRLDVLIIQPAAQETREEACASPSAEERHSRKVAIFRYAQGQILGPVSFSFLKPLLEMPTGSSKETQVASEAEENLGANIAAKSDEIRLAELIDQLQPALRSTSASHMEQLAILKRWYYRSNRTGELFFRDPKDNWPIKRVLKGAVRVASPKGIAAAVPEAPSHPEPAVLDGKVGPHD